MRLTQASGEGGLTYGLAVKDDSSPMRAPPCQHRAAHDPSRSQPNARFVRPASDPSYVLGPVGTATYVLPETQNKATLFGPPVHRGYRITQHCLMVPT